MDISVLTIEGRTIKTISTNGDMHLGGADFDNAILDMIKNQDEIKDRNVDWTSPKGKKMNLRLL